MPAFHMSDKEFQKLLAEGQHSVQYENSLSLNVPVAVKEDVSHRRGKYNAVKKVVDGITFDSTGEADRYSELKFQAVTGIISHEETWLQVPFELLPKEGKQRAITYRVDFVYRCNGVLVAEDFKGFETPAFKMKAKLFRAQYKDYVLWVNKDKRAVHSYSARDGGALATARSDT